MSDEQKLLSRTKKLIGWTGLFLASAMAAIFFAQRDFWRKESDKKVGWFCGNDRFRGQKTELGKELFLNNCASCHHKNMVDQMTGPALRGVENRWSRWPRSDLFQFIRSSQKMIKKGHPRAVAVWKEADRSTMNDFSGLTDEQIEAILAYVERY